MRGARRLAASATAGRLLREVAPLLRDARRLAAQTAEIVQLCAANAALAHQEDRITGVALADDPLADRLLADPQAREQRGERGVELLRWPEERARDGRRLRRRGVRILSGFEYRRIDDARLHVVTRDGPQSLAVDNVILCAGQEPSRALSDELAAGGHAVHVIGGGRVAAELDAKRAIDEGARLAAML